MKPIWTFVALAIIFCWFGQSCEALRCRTEDGPSEEDLKKIARICMKKVGANESNSDEDSRDSDENNNGNGNGNGNNYGMRNRNSDNSYYNGRNGNGNFPNDNLGRQQQPQMSRDWNGYQNGNSQNSPGNFNWNGDGGNGNRDNNRSKGAANSNGNNNQTEHDRACFVHCFFHELKMVNRDDQPDKIKMLTVLTRSIRDVELKQFFIDSIQECFHMFEQMNNNYRRQNDKCDSAQTISNCMTERAKANCEDFTDDVMVL